MWLQKLNKKSINSIEKTLFLCLVLSLTLQTSIPFYELQEWSRGFINPYTNLSFHIFDFFLVITGLFFFPLFRRSPEEKTKRTLLLYAAFFFMLIPVFTWAGSAFYAIGIMVKLAGLILLYELIQLSQIKSQQFAHYFIIVVLLQLGLGLFQIATQTSLGLHVLGEPFINSMQSNLAWFQISDMKLLRAYGTFSHPNVFAAFSCIALSLLFSFNSIFKKHKFLFETLLIALLISILISFSKAAVITAFIMAGLFLYKHQKKEKTHNIQVLVTFLLFASLFIGILLLRTIDPASTSTAERIIGFNQALQIFLENPLGTGLTTMSLSMDALGVNLMPWQYQPVHNSLILYIVEAGFMSFLLMLGVVLIDLKEALQKHSKTLFLFIPIFLFAMTDHFFLSLDQGRYLLVFIIGLIMKIMREESHSKNQDFQR